MSPVFIDGGNDEGHLDALERERGCIVEQEYVRKQLDWQAVNGVGENDETGNVEIGMDGVFY